MISEQKAEANRLNALKSTGPRTPEGRAKSALNAIKHGLCAQTVIISSENSEDFRRFSQSLTADFAPVNQIEKNMVKRIVSLSWRLDRATKYESLVLDKILKAQFEADTQCQSGTAAPGCDSVNVGQASPLDSNSSHPDDSRDSSKSVDGQNKLSKEELDFLQEDLLATAIYNDFRDEGLLERVRRYESQLSRELNSAMDILYKAQTIRIQRRLDDESAHKNVAETLQREHEINKYREENRKHEERFKKMSRCKILDYPGLEDFDEVKLLSVIDYETFRRKVDIGFKPVDIAYDLMKKYNENPGFYSPDRYLETEKQLYNRHHGSSVRRA